MAGHIIKEEGVPISQLFLYYIRMSLILDIIQVLIAFKLQLQKQVSCKI